MIIPNISWTNYCVDNLHSYSKVCLRPKDFQFITLEELEKLSENEAIEYLSHLKDQEIFDLLRVMVGYRSREQLVRLSARALKKKKFFVRCSGMNCHGKLLTIGHGTEKDYHLYSLDGIVDNLSNFSAEEQKELLFLLETYL